MIVMGDIPKIVIKTIVLTYVLLVVGCLYIEYCNVSLYAPYINQYARLSVRKSCEYFSSESYKNDRSLSKTTNYMIIKDNNGNTYHDANFFNNRTTESSIYTYLYDSTDWADWTTKIYNGNSTTTKALTNWKDWGNGGGTGDVGFDTSISMGMYYLCAADNSSGMEKFIGDYYKSSYMTPLNLGIPYIGSAGTSGTKDNAAKSLEKMCRWTLAKLLIAGNDGCIKNNDYVLYNGFRVYTNELTIRDINYRLYNLTSDKAAFTNITNIDSGGLKKDTSNSGNYSIVDTISFDVPVVYEGITPFRRICSWIMTGGGFSADSDMDSDGVIRKGGDKGASGYEGFNNGIRLTKSDLGSNEYKMEKQLLGAYGTDADGKRVNTGTNGDTISGYSSSKLVYYLVH